MGIVTNDLDSFIADLEQKAQKAKSLEGTCELPLPELLNRKFMMQHTSFDNIDDFLQSAGINPQDPASLNEFPEDQLDTFVRKHTTFSSWETMCDTAAEDWFTQQLGF